MAITITQSIPNMYPAYNDSWIHFTSQGLGSLRAEITAFPTDLFPRKFTIYPQGSIFRFNLKEIVSSIFSKIGFEDIGNFTDAYSKSIPYHYLSQPIKIEVFGTGTHEILDISFTFFRSVLQAGEKIHSNDYQLLMNSDNGKDHYMTYNKGFPAHFDIKRVLAGVNKKIEVKNLNNGQIGQFKPPTLDGIFRINIDKGEGKNWITENVLPLNLGLNRLEIYEDNIFQSNLILNLIEKCSGVYLKWLNPQGGYSYFLFDKYHIENLDSGYEGQVYKDDFKLISEAQGFFNPIAKAADRTQSVRARYNQDQYRELRGLLTSPYVQMYSSEQANILGEWIDVRIEGSLSHSNKRMNNTLEVQIVKPAFQAYKL